MNTHNWKTQLWFYCVLSLIVFLFGGLFTPGEWYQSLNRAPWTPPNIAFPIVWSVLYCFIAYTGYCAAKTNDSLLIRLWFAQLAFNAAWSPLFFGLQWVLASLVVLLVLLCLVGAFVVRGYRLAKPLMATLMVPYFVWLTVATSLNAYILLNN